MRLDEPCLVVYHAFTAKPIELQTEMKSEVQISIWARVDTTDLLQVSSKERVARPWVRGICDFIPEILPIKESWQLDLFSFFFSGK